MPRKGENIYKRKDGRWEGRFIKEHINGRAIYGYVYGHSYSEVKQKQRKEATDTRRTSLPQKESDLTNALACWMQTVRPRIKESTYARYDFLIRRHILPELGSEKLSNLSEVRIGQWTAALQCTGRLDGNGGLSAKSIGDLLTILKSSLSLATRNGYEVQCDFKRIGVKQTNREMRVLSVEEQQCLERQLLPSQNPVHFAIILSLYTGLRIGEVCALRWEHIDFEKKCIHVLRTVQRIRNTEESPLQKTKIIITEPKSYRSIRTVPLPKCLLEIASLLRCDPTYYLLTGRADKLMEPRTLQNHFKRIVKVASIPSVSYHALRHTFATRCIESGADVKTLSELLGHTNVMITLNRYVHSNEDRKRQCIECMEASLR